MKQIGVPVNTHFTIADGAMVYVNEALDITKQARRNKLVILEGALTIENQISGLISHYFFGNTHEKKSVFESIVLNSDACTFSTKRRLIFYIINELSLFSGKQKEEWDLLIKRIVSLRNAFSHGSLTSDGTRVWLKYFEGGPKQIEISDDYLTDVETLMHTCSQKCMELSIKLGVTKMAESISIG